MIQRPAPASPQLRRIATFVRVAAGAWVFVALAAAGFAQPPAAPSSSPAAPPPPAAAPPPPAAAPDSPPSIFRVVATAEKAVLGEPFEIYLETSDPDFDPAALERLICEPDALEWHLRSPWRPLTSPRAPASPGAPRRLWFARLQGFEIGERTLPETRVALSDGSEVVADSGAIQILGVRDPQDQKEDLADPKGVREYPRDWRRIALFAALAAVALAVAVALALRAWKKWRASANAPKPEPPLSPSAWALKEIDRLRNSEAASRARSKEIATGASETIRRYFHRRWGFYAMEMTSHEILRVLKRRDLDPRIVKTVRDLFDECDLAKFSRFELPRARLDAIWDEARELVLATTPPEEMDPRRPRAGGGSPGSPPDSPRAASEASS